MSSTAPFERGIARERSTRLGLTTKHAVTAYHGARTHLLLLAEDSPTPTTHRGRRGRTRIHLLHAWILSFHARRINRHACGSDFGELHAVLGNLLVRVYACGDAHALTLVERADGPDRDGGRRVVPIRYLQRPGEIDVRR